MFEVFFGVQCGCREEWRRPHGNLPLACTGPAETMTQPPLYYKSRDDCWTALPAWATFLFHLGTLLSDTGAGQPRYVLGVAVPAKAYAAALLSTGLISSRLRSPLSDAEVVARFERLCALPVGTPLIYRQVGKVRLKGVFAGVETVDGEDRIRLSDARNPASSRLLRCSLAPYVDLAPPQMAQVPTRQVRTKISAPSEFAVGVLGTEEARYAGAVSRLECLTVGAVARYWEEVAQAEFATVALPGTGACLPMSGCEPELAAREDRIWLPGTLQSIIRVSRYLPVGEAYRSEIVASTNEAKARLRHMGKPPVVIFDGALSFLRMREAWRESHWVVILDRTERDFDDAVAVVNKEYMKYRAAKSRTLSLQAIPRGVEVVFYEESR